ncbi:hypothetical protein, partial [Hymenobacter terricola]|uniref:hypothetical protein n=1 Tax=Hymenobacter terricola TaxID=2819236 RepID=UPI001CF5E640
SEPVTMSFIFLTWLMEEAKFRPTKPAYVAQSRIVVTKSTTPNRNPAAAETAAAGRNRRGRAGA